METLKYAFGETPDEVIRERHDTRFTPHDLETAIKHGEDMPAWERVLCVLPETDDLLTVLDALKFHGDNAEHTWRAGPLKPDGTRTNPFPPPSMLRVSILAALGINEGGESDHGIASTCESCGMVTAKYDAQEHHHLGCPVRRAALGIEEG